MCETSLVRYVSKLFLIFVFGPGVAMVLALLMQVHMYACIYLF